MSFRDWDIFDEMARLRRELGHLAANLQAGTTQAEQQWSPPVDILERDDALLLVVDLPGVRKEDIDLRVDGDTLTLEGQRTRDESASGVRLERPMGRFRRSFRIGVPIAPDKVQASWRDGVLEVVLQKTPPQEPVQVRVNVE